MTQRISRGEFERALKKPFPEFMKWVREKQLTIDEVFKLKQKYGV